ncbi:hypothetical protein HDV02_005953 [Globomyces sp. JEL0801]|nr:hypothetical protein HDV02_005953 [Globomyces sp. JEL0801]
MSQFDKPPKPSRSSSQSLSRGSSRIKSTRTTIKETDQNIDNNEGSTPKTIHRQQSKRRTEKNSDTEIEIEKAKSPRKSKRSVSRTSSSKPDKKKSNKIELKSPTTGEKITLAAEDFIDNFDDLSIQNDELEDSKRPILQQESNPNLFGVPSYQEILPKPENDIEVIFVPGNPFLIKSLDRWFEL